MTNNVIWYDSATPYIKTKSAIPSEILTLIGEPNTGNIQVQFKDSLDAWFTPDDITWTVTTNDVFQINLTSLPDFQIIATGDAKFGIVYIVV